jgi:prevent-host-death family protein
MVMITVNIATLKAKLSYYLSEVKKGHEVVVMDRSTPVARLEPIRKKEPLPISQPATRTAKELREMKISPLKHPLTTEEIVRIIREGREDKSW